MRRPRGLLRGISRLVLALYPAAWRARYGPELEEVLDHHRVTVSTVVDLTLSALDAHRHPELGATEVPSPWARLRSGLGSTLLATVLFAPAWALVLVVRVKNPGTWMHADLDGAWMALKFVALTGAAGLAAIMAGALLLASARLRPGQPWHVRLAALALALIACVSFAGLFAAAAVAIDSTASGAVWPVALPVWTIGVAGLVRALAGLSPEPRLIRVSSRLARLGACAMALAFVGSIWLSVALSLEAPAIGVPIIPMALMAAATAWAAGALRRTGSERPSRRQIA